MKDNKFIIITPLYNVEKWIEKLIKSIKLQTHKNYECFLIDDISTDNSSNIIENSIKDDARFKLIKNVEKKFALRNIFEAIEQSGKDPNDIILTLDGDDWLATKRSLEIVNDTYNEFGCLMTYGSYIEFPSKQKGKFCLEIEKDIVVNKTYRKNTWVTSHLRTFKRSLWNCIKIEDLKKDNNFYRMTWDMAFMFPMLEMAGPLACHIDKMLYCYNRQNPLNDDKVNHKLQLDTEQEIRNKKIYSNKLIQGHILGPSGDMSGIGNQLFCVATALAAGYDNQANVYFPQIRKDSFIKQYKSLFYKNLNIGRDGEFYNHIYTEQKFSFSPIKIKEGTTKIYGYFQSYRYFEKHRDKIIRDLNIKEMKDLMLKKYGDLSNHVSIHVRRGDYLKLSDYHHNLDIKYYKKAVSKFNENTKFIIFSNDLEWCKSNFDFLKNAEFSKAEYDWEDIILMSNCRDNIIANSSFSWWGAWLNENKNKKVICPKKWFGPKYSDKQTHDLFPKNWSIIS